MRKGRATERDWAIVRFGIGSVLYGAVLLAVSATFGRSVLAVGGWLYLVFLLCLVLDGGLGKLRRGRRTCPPSAPLPPWFGKVFAGLLVASVAVIVLGRFAPFGARFDQEIVVSDGRYFVAGTSPPREVTFAVYCYSRIATALLFGTALPTVLLSLYPIVLRLRAMLRAETAPAKHP